MSVPRKPKPASEALFTVFSKVTRYLVKRAVEYHAAWSSRHLARRASKTNFHAGT